MSNSTASWRSPRPVAGYSNRGPGVAAILLIGLVLIGAWGLAPMDSLKPGETETIRVDLKLRTGGSLSGLAVDHTLHGLVVVRDDVPYVFAWQEIESGSAYIARGNLVALARGGRENLSAEDHFDLGLFALAQHRPDLASREFRTASRTDGRFTPRAREAMRAYRRNHQVAEQLQWLGGGDVESSVGSLPVVRQVPAYEALAEPMGIGAIALPAVPGEVSEAVMRAYRSFGEKASTPCRTSSKKNGVSETFHCWAAAASDRRR